MIVLPLGTTHCFRLYRTCVHGCDAFGVLMVTNKTEVQSINCFRRVGLLALAWLGCSCKKNSCQLTDQNPTCFFYTPAFILSKEKTNHAKMFYCLHVCTSVTSILVPLTLSPSEKPLSKLAVAAQTHRFTPFMMTAAYAVYLCRPGNRFR